MSRTPGSKNQDHDEARGALLGKVRARLLLPDGASASLRELARAADVSPPTLHHYFPTRDDLVAAVFARDHNDALPYLHHIAAGPLSPLSSSLREVLGYIVAGLQDSGLAELHALGLQVGLRSAALGPAYLNDVLEPSLLALEARLARHAARGDVDAGLLDGDGLRLAALQLLGPILLAVLHQKELGGDRCRALAVDDALLDRHVAAFVRAWSTGGDDDAGDPSSRTSRTRTSRTAQRRRRR